MAITDVLRGLLGGAGGALAGYGIQQQREQERLERERIRQEDAAEREADRAYRRQIDEQTLALELLGRQARGEITPTEYVEYAEPSDFLRGERIGMQRQPSADLSSLLADEGIGMQRSQVASAMAPRARDGRMEGGAMVAPGQTYSAIDAALAEAPKPEDIGARGRRATQDLDRALTIEPEDIAARFRRAPAEGSWTAGRGTFEGLGGQMYRATTTEERAAKQLAMEEAALDRAAADVVAAGKAIGLNLTPEQGRAIASGEVRFADLIPEAPKTTDPTSLQQNLKFLIDLGYSKEEALNRLQPLPAGRAGSVEGLSGTDIRRIYDQAQRRLANEIEARTAAMEFRVDAPPQYTPEEARDRLREIIEEETETFLGIGVPREPELPPAPAAPPAPGAFLDLARGNFMQRSLLGEQASAIDEEQRQAGLAYLERFQQEQRDERNRLRR